ncbi:MAG TPA: chemotaxis protein CheB [Verrucomicrobiae bacterium]|jgi:two-component system chemotaxis response regulator CheB|nr:chemotaxis protein CheB [Verrucomicrobiae bacterium]
MTNRAVVIGASAGAIEALSKLLPALPAKYPWPILLVVHVPPDTRSALPELFAPKCRIAVKEAEDKEKLRPGVAYFAPPNYHLLVETDGALALSSEEPELFSRPSINVLFDSAADAFGSDVVGVILTGASADGAEGLRKIRAAGGMALAQDPKTAQCPAMPEAALAACPGARAMGLAELAALLASLPEEGAA